MRYKKPFGIMFHHFHNERHKKGQGSISEADFEAIILHYKDNIISAKDWYIKATINKLSDNEICLTFDDALLCQCDVALPVLRKYNLTAFWFVHYSVLQGDKAKLEIYRKFRNEYFSNIDEFYELFFKKIKRSKYQNQVKKSLINYDHNNWKDFPFYSKSDTKFRFVRDKVLKIGQYSAIMSSIMHDYGVNENTLSDNLWMSKLDIQSLSNEGHIIGLHSHTHPTNLGLLSVAEQRIEYETNYNFLKHITKSDINAMSHPCNSYTQDTLNILENLGFRSNMSDCHHSMYEFPREDHINILRRIS